MKKLDLHIHTIQTVSDHPFSFSIDKLKEYVQGLHIDGIAVTNHNLFDATQFKNICNALSGICVVLPGIEINLGANGFGHMICISSPDDIDDFSNRCSIIQTKITTPRDRITYNELRQIFGDLNRYLWIPHYDKKPTIDPSILEDMKEYLLCGEIGSVKKFIYKQKDTTSLIPLLFSDLRPTEDLDIFPTRQTYFDIDEISINAIKKALLDRNHVSLTEYEGKNRFYVLPDLPISTGLNIIIGERSSGKTYTLDQISKHNENVKYIKQFSLVETNPEDAARKFADHIAAKRSSFAEEYFEPLKDAIDIVKSISSEDDDLSIEDYLSSLIRYARETDRADMFARCALYGETKFPDRSFDTVISLIESIEHLLDAREYKDIIEKYVQREALIALRKELIITYNREKRRALEESWVNDVVANIKRSLVSRSAAVEISDIDFYKCQMNRVKVKKFNQLISLVKQERTINRQEIESFVVQTKKRPFTSASELRSASGKRDVTFSRIIDDYTSNPYRFLRELGDMPEIPEVDYYKYFAYVDYQILNQYGFQVSGGERAEFNLLQNINDAYRYDMLLIDEPESSFDNLFLRDRVNHIIKELSKLMPVILVTHNNTVGASIKPDFVIYTKRVIADDIHYERYYGLPSSKELISSAGEKMANFEAMLDCLEAGEETYNERKHDYDLLKN